MFAADDAFIHRRIAEHLLQTGRAYFNTNERVMVTSSPVWTIVLALLSATPHANGGVLLFESLSVAAASTLALLLARAATAQESQWIRILITAVAVLTTFSMLLQSAVQQMETPLAVTLLLAGLFLLDVNGDAWLAVLILAANTRYEINLILPVALLAAGLLRKLNRKAIGWGAIAWLASTAWLLWQYGTLIPHTVKAKSIAYLLSMTYTFYAQGLSRVVLLMLLVILVGIAIDWRRLSLPGVLLFVFGLEVCAAYTVRKTFIFPWYLPLSHLPLLLGVLLGPVFALRWWTKIAAIGFFCVFTQRTVRPASQEVAAAVTGQTWRDRFDEVDLRVADYLIAGPAIEQVCPQARLMTSEIGGLGYGFPGEVLDAFGLATPSALRWHPMKVPQQRNSGAVGAIPAGFFNEMHPDVVVTYPVFSEELMREYDRSQYVELKYPSTMIRQDAETPEYWATLIVLVARNGACPVHALDTAMRSGFGLQ